jgi:hypothetical protein
MTFVAPKRIRGERPSKEERQRALIDAIRLPMSGSQPAPQAVVIESVPVDRPALLRSRDKYAA